MTLEAFIAESNRIEGIWRAPTRGEIDAHECLLELATIDTAALCEFVMTIAQAALRDRKGMNVRVGDNYAPPGGGAVKDELVWMIDRAMNGIYTPYRFHLAYESLHPFMDGNGRSGRALWLWMMKKRGEYERALDLGFLHLFYYQALEASR